MCISKKHIKYISNLIPKIVLVVSIVFVLYVTKVSITDLGSENSKIAAGTLEILSFTLITLLFYTYYTYRMAVKKERSTVVATIGYISQFRDVRVMLKNPTNLYAETYINLSVKIYGDEAELGPEYSGKTPWHLSPQFEIHGHFKLDEVLNQFGKTYDGMFAEANYNNTTNQLRMSLKVDWQDEVGEFGKSPEHCWFFDFKKGHFVYKVGGFEK